MIWTQPTLSPPGNTHCINIYSECTDLHCPHCSQAYTILGKDLKVVDLDQDGSLDLIVTAPGVSGWIISIDNIYCVLYPRQVRGCVHVILGLEGSLAPASLGSNLVEEVASISLCSELEYARWGSHLQHSCNYIYPIIRFGTSVAVVDWNQVTRLRK